MVKDIHIPVTKAFDMEIRFTRKRTPSLEKRVVGDESESMESDTESRAPSPGNFLSRWFSDRSEASLFSLSRTFSGLYCLMVISIYISVTINKLTSSPMHAPEVEVSALLLYLYLLSCLFLLYLLLCLVRHPHTHDHVRSHGSGFLRQGAVVFGIGSFIYHLLEFITYFIIDLHPNCLDIVHTVISFLAIIFILLQTVTIIMYPRLNIQLANGIPHLGLMHVVATNLILWMRTVIRESFHAFHEATELKLNSPLINVNLTSHYDNSSSEEDVRELGIRARRSAEAEGHSDHGFDLIEHFDMEHCANKYHDDDFVEDILQQSSPFLFCFIIEFSLVGCTVFYNTWNNVHTRREAEDEAAEMMASASRPVVRKPNLCATLAKTNWSHSTMGTVSGCFVLLLTLLDLIVFFSSTGGGPSQEAVFEYLGKVLNTFINFLGICSAVAGFIQIQNLEDKEDPATKDNGVDLFLIDFGVFFIFIYSSLTITVGVFNIDPAIPGSVHILNGVVEIIAVTFQTLLIHQLLIKTIKSESAYLHGRQVVAFLSFLNFSIWLFDTFELPRSKASLIEAKFYGASTWVWLQRITLPICIFFRFHSTVVLVDCWKNSYRHGAVETLINTMNRILM